MNQDKGSLFNSIASKASEVSQKSWGGFSNLVNSTSLNSFTVPFKGNYEDLGSPEDTQQKKDHKDNYHEESDTFSNIG